MKFKDFFNEILSEEKTFNEYGFDGYVFYIKAGLDGNIPHIHYRNKNGNFGCFALEYCGYFNHSEEMKPMKSSSEKKLINLLATTNFWKEACLEWYSINPTNPVRIEKDCNGLFNNPYKNSTKMVNPKGALRRVETNYVEIVN